MGVSGTGKSTVGGLLAGRLGWAFAEGDDLHPAANVAKMASGHPLTDDDRWPWLRRVAAWIDEHSRTAKPGIITCSALKRAYRDELRGRGSCSCTCTATTTSSSPALGAARALHAAPLLSSQLADLEPPAADENAIDVDVSAAPAAQATQIIDQLGLG